MPFRRPFFGQTYHGDLSNYPDWWVYFFGSYERHVVALLRLIASIERSAGRSVTYVDVGANLGHHVLAMANVSDRIVAVEPFSEYRAILEARTRHLRHCDVVATGFSDQSESRRYQRYGPTQTGHFSAGGDGPPTMLAPGDSLLTPPVSIVKIDVDGFEDRVLLGMQETLQRDRPWIVIEWTPERHATTPQIYNGLVAFAIERRKLSRLTTLPTTGSSELLLCPAEKIGALRQSEFSIHTVP